MKKITAFILKPTFVLSLNVIWGLIGIAAQSCLIPGSKTSPTAFIALLLVACNIFSLALKTPPKPLLAITIAGNLLILIFGIAFALVMSYYGSFPALGVLLLSMVLVMLPLINCLSVLNRWSR